VKKPISFRLSEVAIKMITVLAKRLSVSQVGVVEIAIRNFARKEKIDRIEEN